VRAVAFFEHGGPEVIRVVDDWPEPTLRPGQVLVKVEACSLNRMDLLVRRGLPGVPTDLPRVPGADIAGTIIDVARDVRGLTAGRRVLIDPMIEMPDGRLGALGENTNGGMVERIAVPAVNAIPLSDEVTFESAAALPLAYGTAHRMIVTRGQVKAGEIVVVLGASGGLGTAAVQIAALRGAEVVAVASSPEKLERLAAIGAKHLVEARGADYGAAVWKLTGKRGADVIIDTIGADTWPTTLRTVAPGGRILVCGATTGFNVSTDLRYIWVRESTIIGSDGYKRADLETLLSLLGDGKISPVIDRVIGFTDIRAAQQAMEERSILGKIIVTPHS
jgi:alcohol dehydrogenase